MSFADEFLAQAPEGYHLPHPLRQAFDYLEELGHGEVFEGGGYLAVSSDPASGAVFFIDFDLSGYLDTQSPEADKVVATADPDGGGSKIVAWAGPDGTGEYRYCLLGPEGEGPFLIANNTIDLLRLLAVGYTWIGQDTLGRTPQQAGADDSAGVADFRSWVERTFDVDVPAAWPAGELDQGFAEWLVDLRGGDDEGLNLDGLVPEPESDGDEIPRT